MASARPRPSARPAVLIFITMFTNALSLAALPVSPMYLLVTERASRIGLARSKASCLPPHMR